MWKPILILSLAAGLLGCALMRPESVAQDGGVPQVGEAFPDVMLPAPEDPAMRAYLGLGAEDTFSVNQVDADVVLVEIFSMYCPYCQREAPVVNEFYRVAQQKSKPGKTVKILGIGVGNSRFEVDVFRKKYQVPFPLIADGDYRVHKLLGQTRTPHFIAIRRSADGSRRVIYSQPGSFGDPEDFFNKLTADR